MNEGKELEDQATKLLVENGYDREGRDYKADQIDPLIIWPENEAILQVEGSKSFTTQRNHFATDPKREIEGRKPYGLTKVNALARDYYPCHSNINGWFNALDQKVLQNRKGKAAKQAAQKSNSKKTANKPRPQSQKYQSQAEKQKAYRQRKKAQQKACECCAPSPCECQPQHCPYGHDAGRSIFA